MKILVLCLLRLGDIVLATPVLRGLRRRYPKAEIHLLMNGQFAQIAELMPDIDRVIFFEREEFQRGLGDIDRSLFEPRERLDAFVTSLEKESYDLAINLTQNRLSGYLMRLIHGPAKMGLSLDADGRATFGSPWFRYLNSQSDAESEDVFHFSDVFRFALGLDQTSRHPLLSETEAGHRECEQILDGYAGRFVVVQPFTSDVKKDWGLMRFADMIRHFSQAHPSQRVYIMAAPHEQDRLQPLLTKLRDSVSPTLDVHLAVCSFAAAFSLLRKAAAIVTGDTAIKHLACAARTRLLEICLGSSDLRRTGAYLQNSVIISSKETCAPCVHSSPCHRASHVCAERLSPEAVAMVFSEVLTGDLHQLPVIAQEFKDEMTISRVEIEESGFWAAVPVLEAFSEASVGRWLGLCGQKLHLEAERSKLERLRIQHAQSSSATAPERWTPIGSDSVRLERLLRKMHPKVSHIEWAHLFETMERQAMLVENRITGFQTGLRSLLGAIHDPEHLRTFVRGLIAFRAKLKAMPFLQSSRTSLDLMIEDDITPAFTRVRRIGDALNEIRMRTEIELKLIRALKNRMEISA